MDYTSILLIVGVILAGFGWTIYWFGIQTVGAVVGMAAGTGIGFLLTMIFDISGDGVVIFAVVGCVAGVVIGVILTRKFHKGIFFLLGAVGASLLCQMFLPRLASVEAFSLDMWLGVGARLVICAFCGILAVKFSRYVVSFVTAGLGTGLILAAFEYQHAILIGPPVFLAAFFLQTKFLKRFIVRHEPRES